MKKSVKLLSWNVNGLRACGRAGFLNWFQDQSADVVCLQEIKVQPEQLGPELLNPKRYHSFWEPAKRPGYSGVAIFSKKDPIEIRHGIGIPAIDNEGRILTAEFGDFTIVSAYFPNSQRDHARLEFKLKFCREFLKLAERERQRGKTLLVCGDFNIAHNEIDLKNPKTNKDNAGFLPEERAWMTEYLGRGYSDCFRHFSDQRDQYTWWSQRPGVRERNIGWRLDYFTADADSRDRLKSMHHQTGVRGSDHCPIVLELRT